MTKLIICAMLCVICTSVNATATDLTATTPLTDQQVDQVFDNVFAMQKKLKYLTATLITTTKGGGIFKKDVKNLAEIKAKLPNKVLRIDKGKLGNNTPESQYSYILLDGLYFWDMKPVAGKPGAYETDMKEMKRTADSDLDLVAMLVGADVASGKELREYFNITGALETYNDNTQSYYFHLKTVPGKEKRKRKEDVELWIREGEVIPWKVHNITLEPVAKANDIFGGGNTSGSSTSYKKTEKMQEITEVKSNLSTPPLPPLPYTIFWFGTLLQKYPNNQIVDSKGNVIDKLTQQQVLTNVLTVLQKP